MKGVNYPDRPRFRGVEKSKGADPVSVGIVVCTANEGKVHLAVVRAECSEWPKCAHCSIGHSGLTADNLCSEDERLLKFRFPLASMLRRKI
jgi:hypothetical protein